MKTKFIIFFLLFSKVLLAQEQNDKTVYLDSLRQEIPQGNHKYYKVIKDYALGISPFIITIYLKSGKILSKGTYNDKEGKICNGDIIFYYESGGKKAKIQYQENRPIGKATYWYENGQLKEEGEYVVIDSNTDKREFRTNQFWSTKNEHTVIDGNGIYIREDVDYIEKTTLKNGITDGLLTYLNYKDNSSYSEIYENGKFISGKTKESDGTEKEYLILEKKPEPKKGLQDFYNYIGSHFRYSKESIKNKIFGKLILKFVVDRDGKIIEAKIIKGLGFGLDEEAIRVITSYENWNPGEQRGIAVRCLYTLPLSLKAE